MSRYLLLALLMVNGIALGAIRGEEVEYKAGGTTLKGYIAYDDSIKGKRPGILVIHEWWGATEYVRKRARMLAELGYTALAVDMYGGGKTVNNPDEAGKLAGSVRGNPAVAKERFLAAYGVLANHKSADPTHMAAIGYCFGGGVALEMVRMGVDLDGVVSFHGSLTTEQPAKPGQVVTSLLVLNGADDPLVKPADIDGFKKEMLAAGIDYQFINYPGAVHAFTNPEADTYGKKFNLPLAYNAKADQESWTEMRGFLDRIFTR